MTDEFIRQGLTTSVAQICSNIGWHSMSNSTLQMMTDILYEYFKDLAQSVKKFSEISDTLNPDIDDVNMAFRDKDVVIPDLVKYLKQVGSIEFPHRVPKFPVPTKSNLNIMKPGSREIVTRPVYVHENLPTIYPEPSGTDEKTIQNDRTLNQSQIPHTSTSIEMSNNSLLEESQAKAIERPLDDNKVTHRRLREISSVVMTTSGFLSPSREGKLPESRLLPFPNFKVNSLKPTSSAYPIIPPEVKGESHRPKKLSQKPINNVKEKGKNIIEKINTPPNITKPKIDNPKIKKLASMKETSKLKVLKTGAIRESNQGPRLKKPPKIKDKSKLSLLNTIFDKPVQMSSHSKYFPNAMLNTEKLTTEPDKQKLNIFKKIPKVKEDNFGHQISKSTNSLNISRYSSTIVSSDLLVKPEIVEQKSVLPISTKPILPVSTKPILPVPTKLIEKPIEQIIEEKNDEYDNLHKCKDELKPELNSNVPKKRKKKQSTKGDIIPIIDATNNHNENKKSKTKHSSDSMYSSPMKFSFFGPPGILPTEPSLLPPSLASNPLIPKYIPPINVLPKLEKESIIQPLMYLHLPGEDEIVKSEFDELLSPKKKISTEMIKTKKEHKKIKKNKIKSKKKKDKKDKSKQKDRSERKKEKLLKKLKNKEKAKSEESKQSPPNLEEEKPSVIDESLIPKIKLKFAGSKAQSSSPSVQRKIVIKPVIKNKSPLSFSDEPPVLTKEKSPVERVKSSVTKSNKEKTSVGSISTVSLTTPNEEKTKTPSESKPKSKKKSTVSPSSVPNIGNSSPSTSTVTSSHKHKGKPIKKSKKTTVQKHPAFYFDESGNQVWICPTCGKQDDGSPMIGCDGCDAWYHW
ncbi:Hypothetical protein CINCED_3A004761 [Cinara cedri]|nr:Hypothetical protein CINCED_3A004761 [Cinara cedri]